MNIRGIVSSGDGTVPKGSAWRLVAKLLQPAACLVILLCAGGCDSVIDFEGETIVLPDSAVTRRTRVTTNSVQLKDELETRYTLPPDGKWESGKRTKRGSDGKEQEEATSIYEVEKQYPPGSPIASDYVRRATHSKQVSRNEPRLTVRNYVFVKTFDYEERFRDIVTENLEKTARNIYERVVEHGAGYLAQERHDGLTAAQASTAIRSAFDTVLAKFLDTARNEGTQAASTFLEREFNPEQVVARVIEVLPPATGQDAESWRKAIAEAYSKAISDFVTVWEKDPAFKEAIFGVRGFQILGPHYEFKVAVSLPGELVEGNATRQEGDRLVWAFRSEDFLWKDQILRARSRLVYPERIAVAGAAFAAILAVLLFVWLRTRSKRTGSSRVS